jgi:hypothetical protein
MTVTRIKWHPGTVVNFDNHGSVWGYASHDETEASLAEARTRGAHIDEWTVTDRDGQPLRVVRIADPEFLDDICVFA